MSLTPDGERLYARCGRLLGELEALQAEASGSRERSAGRRAAGRRVPSGRDRPWHFRQAGRDVEIQPAARIRIDDGEGIVAAARLGLGIAQVPDYFVRRELASGELVEVLRTLRPATLPVLAVYPGARLVPARVRAFLRELKSLAA